MQLDVDPSETVDRVTMRIFDAQEAEGFTMESLALISKGEVDEGNCPFSDYAIVHGLCLGMVPHDMANFIK